MSRQHFLLAGLVGASLLSLVYAARARSEANAMAGSRDQLRASLADARDEIRTLSSKLDSLTNAMAAPAPEPVEAAPVPPRPRSVSVRRRPAAPAPARRKVVEDPRW